MIARAVLLTYRDGPMREQNPTFVDIGRRPDGTFPAEIEVFPSTRYWLVTDREVLAHRSAYDALPAVYLVVDTP